MCPSLFRAYVVKDKDAGGQNRLQEAGFWHSPMRENELRPSQKDTVNPLPAST